MAKVKKTRIIKEGDPDFETVEELSKGAEDWEPGGVLGRDPAHAKFNGEKSMGAQTKTTTFRLSLKMIRDLKAIAEAEGIPYQTLVKSVLHKFIEEKKRA